MGETADLCAYCAETALTGSERPEHPIPAALGASLIVKTVCDSCNTWAGKDIDQPFLSDDWVREHRSQSGLIDPRRGSKGRPVSSKLLQGYTDEGDFISIDRDGNPKLRSRIIEFGGDRSASIPWRRWNGSRSESNVAPARESPTSR
jgi:HNH endonuclease